LASYPIRCQSLVLFGHEHVANRGHIIWLRLDRILKSAMRHAQRTQPPIDPEDIQRRIEEQYALVEALQEWLDHHLPN
jgi:hypothetical protein